MPEISGSSRSPNLFQFLSASIDEAPEGILAFDTECRYVLWNRRMEEISGKKRDEVLGRSAFEAFPFLVEVGEDKFFDAALKGASSESTSRQYSVLGGKSGYFDASYRPIRNDSGEIIGGIGHIRDCTKRTVAEQALKHEAEVLDTMIRTAETVTAELDLTKVVQAATDAATQISGAQFGAFFYNVVNERGESYMLYTISGVPKEAFSKFPMPRNTEVFAPTFRGEGVVRSGNIKEDPRYGKNAPRKGMPEGHLPVCSYLAVPVMSRSGDEVFGGLFFGHSEPDRFTESSERLVSAIARLAASAIENARLYDSERRARARAEESESRLSSIWSSMSDAFVFLDREWKCQYANERACEFIQKPCEELENRTLWEVLPQGKGTRLDQELTTAWQQQTPRHFEYYFGDADLWFEWHAYPSQDGVGVYFRDITTEKKAKQEIQKAEDRLRLIATTTDVGTWYCDLPFDVLEWSAKTKEHFWLPPDAVVTIDTFYKRIHPQDRERTRRTITESIEQNRLYDIDYRTVSEDGQIKWIRAIGRTFYDDKGQPIRFDGITLDQTARRSADEALRRSERLATAGRLAATVAHEVNNPLEAVTNLIYLCQHDPAATDSIRTHLQMADEELRRVAHIVRQTLGFYRENSAPQQTNLAELISNLTDVYRKRYMEKRVTLRTQLEQPVYAQAVPGEIRQVVANLLSNALDACGAGAEVLVSMHTNGDGVEIAVADTGYGISEANKAKVFEPFFTTKTDVGTGLGLWVSKGIVEKHGGELTMKSSTDPKAHGTVFSIFLPLRQSQQMQLPA
ncbi:MAG: PAS domain-containing protein [Terriglobales bacterium]